MNQAGWTFCANCGSPAAMAGGMPPAGGTPTPPPAYPAYPPYGYASPWEAERQKQIGRTKTGLLLLLIGGLISWIPIVNLLGGLLLLIGAILVIIGRKAFGATHSRNVIVALVLFIFAIVGIFALAIVFAASLFSSSALTDPVARANAIANALNTFLIGAIVVGAIQGIASVLFTYALQQKIGKTFLWAGFAAGVAINIAVFAIISAAFANAIAQASSGGTFDSAPFVALQGQISALGFLSVIPAILFAAATYFAWSRVNRGEIPPPSVPPGMPPGMPMMTPPGGASPPM